MKSDRSYVRTLVASALFVATFLDHPCQAAVIDSQIINGSTELSVVGEIVPGDAADLEAAVERAQQAGLAIKRVTLNSIGGNAHEGVSIVSVLRSNKLDTRVPTGGTCASVCFLAFAAGLHKSVAAKARIGVHVASGRLGDETPGSIEATAAMARIAQHLLVPPEIIARMVSTPAAEMFWLSSADLAALGAIREE